MAKIKFITVAIIVLTFGLSATITAPGTDVDLGNLPVISEDDPPCLQMYYLCSIFVRDRICKSI